MSSSLYTSGEYLTRHPAWHLEHSSWKAKQVLRMLARHELSPRSICEVGCGAGRILKELETSCPAGTRFWGYEISPQALSMCTSIGETNIQFVLGSVCDDPGRTFELILLMDVVEHVEDYISFLKDLKPLSRFKILHFPLDLSVQGLLRDLPVTVRESAGHLHYFTKSLAIRALEDTGYTVIDSFYTGAAIDFPATSWKSRLGRLPRRSLFSIHEDAAALLLGGYSLLVLAS